MRAAGLLLDQIRLALGVGSSVLGADTAVLDQVREILARMAQESRVADELTAAVRDQLTKRRGNHVERLQPHTDVKRPSMVPGIDR